MLVVYYFSVDVKRIYVNKGIIYIYIYICECVNGVKWG